MHYGLGNPYGVTRPRWTFTMRTTGNAYTIRAVNHGMPFYVVEGEKMSEVHSDITELNRFSL